MPNNSERTQAKQQWLTQRLKNFNQKQSSFNITQQSRPTTLPLSFAQQRLWFLDQWEPGSSAYLLSYSWRLRGPLNRSALEASLTALVARHESLRTTFSVIDGQPVQIIAPMTTISLPYRDLTVFPEETKEDKLTRFLEKESSRPFDLATGPLWRSQLLRMAPEEHAFLLTLHHIITDGWSMRIIFQELSTLYAGQVTGQPMTLSPLPLQYADFAIWQRQRLQGEFLEQQLSYWRTHLAGAPSSLELPLDAPRPLQQSYRGDGICFTLSPTLTLALKKLSQQEGVTLFMTLLAAFQILLSRYTDQRDILVGTPIAGRTHTELEGLIGFFVNTLVLRTQFKGQPTFREILHQVRETCLNAYAHQDLPFEKLVEALQLVRDPSRHPLIQVMFQLHHADSTGELTLPNLEVARLPSSRQTAKFDLSVDLVTTGEKVHGTVTFNTDLFKYATIKNLATHFHKLLEGLVADPTQAVHRLPLLSAAESHQLLIEWNPLGPSEPLSPCVHHLVEAQTIATPDAVAIQEGNHHLTYAALDQRASHLAQYLIGQGIGTEVRVGIYTERSLAMMVVMLGILKSGGAYVPLDPTIPVDRLRYMVKDAQVEVVVTSAILRSQLTTCLPPIAAVDGEKSFPILAVDEEWPPSLCKGHNHKTALPDLQPGNLAYVMYTSGSTGQPKGVMISHRNIVRLVQSPTYLNWPDPAVCLQLASPAFDAATFEIWATLAQGGRLILGPNLLPSFDDIGALLQDHQITLLWLTAGLFHQLADWNLQAFRPLHTLLAGGDVLSPRHVRRMVKQLPTCQLINGYGPTENTTFTCCFPVPQDGNVGEAVPIGRPIPQTQAYVFDTQQQLVPVGVAGELWIGGHGLARGYQGRPDWTAESFRPHPYSLEPGARLYRSGDHVRYRHDRMIAFLSRKDHQVKIRGYRIECGEIESILTTHPAVRDTAVLPREDSVGNKRLVAYIVPECSPPPNISEFRDFLSRSLPSYMVPTAFILLDAFPLTANGKVDRRKLPAEDQRSAQVEEMYVAPRNSLESQLTKIWETVLERPRIGITDNFFDLGGESLMAVRLCSEMERALHKKIPVPLIFHTQTIEQLADRIGKGREENQHSLLVPIQSSGSKPPIFDVLLGKSFKPYIKNYPDQPLYMFIHQGHDGRPAVQTTVEDIATRYVKEMRTVQPRGPYYLVGYSVGGLIVFEMAQQLRKQGETVGLLTLIDPTTPLPKTVPSNRKTRLKDLVPTAKLRGNESFPGLTTIPYTISTKIWAALRWRFQKLINPFSIRFKKFICKVYFGLGYPLPKFVRHFYLMSVVKQAAKQYIPQHYPGRIALFQTQKNLESYWSKLCGEKVQVYDIPCKHMEIYKEGPHIQPLFQHLMKQLEEAQKDL
ncbi:MAG TPA: amino acid adenylation domain-containing protein [Nitrospirales bacterium]|nr:non-ribosomal peptide synthetase [Nitrospiraceae bacterium]HNP27625.1 amino acid adenylation domain-containing protein [Nitrospirales bacterium]